MRPEEIFQDIVDFMIFGHSISSVVEVGTTSTINTSDLKTLANGMLVEIGDKVYQVSNITTNAYADYSFDVEGTGITAGTWQLALYYEFGHSVEVGNTLVDQKKDPVNKNKRFPLMWLSINIDKTHTEMGYSAPITIAFIYLSEQNLKANKRIDNKFEPILDPLVTLFKNTITNSVGKRYFYQEFGETLEITETDRFNYGSVDGKHVFSDIADAIQLDMDLNFFEFGCGTQIEPTPISDVILTATSYQTSLAEIGIEMAFSGSKTINFDDSTPILDLVTDIETTHNYNYLGRYNIEVESDTIGVTKLVFDNSQLIALDIDQLIGVTYLDLGTNSLPDISIALFPELIYLDLSSNSILSANIDTILSLLDGFGKSNGTLLIATGNGVNTSASYSNIINLEAKGWTLDVYAFPNTSQLTFQWGGSYDGTSLLNTVGTNVPFVSGTGLNAIYDFSVLSDVRLNKNASIDNILSLPEYYDPTFQSEIYFDAANPYHWKLQDFQYRYISLQLVDFQNVFFARANYTASVLQNISKLLIYDTEQESADLSNLYTYIDYNLPIPTFITEDRARFVAANDSLTYTGNTITLGAAGDYTTFTDAWNAASDEDTISLLEDLNTANEVFGFIYILSEKKVQVNGNGFTITNTDTATHNIRIRVTGKLRFINTVIISNTSTYAVYIEKPAPLDTLIVFEDCQIYNKKNNPSSRAVFMNGMVGGTTSKIEIINTKVYAYYGKALQADSSAATGYIYSIDSIFYQMASAAPGIGYLNTSGLKSYIYDSKVFQNGGAVVCRIGEDTAAPSINYSCDIRNSRFDFIGNAGQHHLLIGRGVNDAYIINNTINSYDNQAAGLIGIVVKSIGSVLTDCVFKGNYIRSYRPILIKGAKFNDVQENVLLDNSVISTQFENGLQVENIVEDVVLNSDENNIQVNKIYGKVETLYFDSVVGSEDIKTTVNNCSIDYNEYYSYSGSIWAEVNLESYAFVDKANLWTGANDENSEWANIVVQDGYNNE